MEIRESAEDYLEMILIIYEQKGEVRSIDIANGLGYSKPSISIAMKKLRENGYIRMDDNAHITLTEKGKEIAQNTLSKHRLLRKVLIAIGVAPENAEKEACKIEHDISDKTFHLIEKYYEQKLNERS